MATEDTALSARGVVTGYGDLQVLYGVDIDVGPDEVVLVFGPNGSGKSTLMRAIYGLRPLWEGTVTLAGRDVSAVPPQDRADVGMGFVPQVENVFPNLTVAENLAMGGRHIDDPGARSGALYDLFPALEERRGAMASTLSGGQRQMLAMALALMVDPDVLIIDEPSAGLAPQLVEQTFDHIQQVNDAGTAVLMVEQNVEAGLAVADRGYALENGEVRFSGPADELLVDDQINDLYLGL